MSTEPRRNETYDVERFKRLWDSKATVVEIAEMLRVGPRTITRRVDSLGLPKRRAEVDFWTDEKVAALKLHVTAGLNFAEIARKLGCTRNAAISKAQRVEVNRPESPSAPRRAIRPKPKATAGMAYVNKTLVRAKFSNPPPRKASRTEAFKPLPGATPIPLVGRHPSRCGWPVGGEGADTLCCGLRKVDGPYCAEHALLSRPKPQVAAANLKAVLKGTKAA